MSPVATTSATRPSESTAHPNSIRRLTQIRWVFPASEATPIRDKHRIGRCSGCEECQGAAHCHTVLPGSEISRHHAKLRVDGPLATIIDAGSRNKVYLNGARCEKGPLKLGDVIRCGEWVGVVVADTDSVGFQEILPGWFGGAILSAAVEPAKRVTANMSVLIEGETGTGKEGLARAVHEWSGRDLPTPGPFVAVNCAELGPELADSALFGHKKGAFTGADQASVGLFRAAHGGTIFLDEILELPQSVQAKLLRVLEQREVLPVGETTPVRVDVRVVTASQAPLEQAVAEGRFRGDLYMRLNGLTLTLPPLRSRREDIVPLFQELVQLHAGERHPALDTKLVEAMCLYDWPFNVRELVQVTKGLLTVNGHEPMLKKAHLPERILRRLGGNSESPLADSPKRSWQPVEDEDQFEALVVALRNHGGNVTKAAAAIGINRGRANRLLEAHREFSVEQLREKRRG